jgi:hypothetical protein
MNLGTSPQQVARPLEARAEAGNCGQSVGAHEWTEDSSHDWIAKLRDQALTRMSDRRKVWEIVPSDD